MRCKLLQKTFTGKATECSKHLYHIVIEKNVLSELNRCIFQILLKYIKLAIPKILFILVLCSFNFYFKITWPPPSNKIKISDPPPPAKTFLKFLTPRQAGSGGCMLWFPAFIFKQLQIKNNIPYLPQHLLFRIVR